jgi:hypothetical protein
MSCTSDRQQYCDRSLRNLCLVVLGVAFCCSVLSAQAAQLARPDQDITTSASEVDSAEGVAISSDRALSFTLPTNPTPAVPPGESSSRVSFAVTPSQSSSSRLPNAGKFDLKGALIESFNTNLFFDVWRVAFDPFMRYNLSHKPFFHDWFASYGGYDMHRWGDGDDFIVNDVGHPLEGGVFARIFLIHSPNSQVVIGKNRRYWISRLKAMGWAAAWSTQLEIGPISETDFGNQGGYTYVPGCGLSLSCLNNPKYHKPPTNNTGWTDFVVTPLVGTAWVLGEDTIDKYIVSPVAVNHKILGGRILRSALEPTRSFAAIFSGKFPWQLPAPENNFVVAAKTHPPKPPGSTTPLDRWEIGTQYTNVSLPVLSNDCGGGGCRKNLSAAGFNFDYNFSHLVAFDSNLNFIPGQQGTKPMMEGLFGVRVGHRYQHVGVFGKVRPGFIYYESAMPGGGAKNPDSLTRFATDFGGVVEVYPARKSTLRFDVGTTLVRYLSDHPDHIQYPLGSLLSTDYIVTQGNFQVSTSYLFRF